MAVTKLENMVNPQVMADMISASLEAEMKFAPLAKIDTTLQGQPGNTVTLPKYKYIGDAEDVAEGAPIPIEQMATSTEEVSIKKAGKGVELTDESVLSGYGDPMGEATKQIRMSIANKVDNDVLDKLGEITPAMTVGDGTAGITSDLLLDALVKFGENIDGEKVLIIAPKQLAELKKSEDWIKQTEIGANILISGTVGMLHGCQVVLSNKIKAVGGKYTNYIIKPGALAIYLKRDTMVEKDRDIIHDSTVITANKHYTTHIADDTKAIKLITKE